MASLQTTLMLATGGAALPAPKPNAPAQKDSDTKFAAMLTDAAPKPQVNNSGKNTRNEASTKKNDAPAKDTATSHKADNASKTASRKNDKADNTDDKAASDAKQAQAADAHKSDDKKSGDPKSSNNKNDDGMDADARPADASNTDQANAAQIAQPSCDPAALAQQILAAPAPAAPPAPGNDNGNGNDNDADDVSKVAGAAAAGNAAPGVAGAKPGRPAAAPPTPARTAANTPAQAGDDDGAATDDPDGVTAPKAATPASAAQAALKAVGHGDAKTQSATIDAAKTEPSQPDQPQVVAAPAPPPPPSSTMAAANMANANVAGVTASGTAPTAASSNAAAGSGAGVAVHVAPQDAAPNVNSLAVEIAARSQAGSKEFHIRLDPPELGHVEVRLSIDASGKAEAHMTADQPQALDLLQKHAPSLTSALRDAGLDVSQNGLNFSLKGQDRQGSNNGGGANGAQAQTPSRALTATKTIDAAQSANAYLSSAGDARLDIHV